MRFSLTFAGTRIPGRVSWALQANYTVSKLIDTDTDILGSMGGSDDIYTIDPTRIFLERSLSTLDATQRFTANWIIKIPFRRDQVGLLGKILGGWQLNGTSILQSGHPFSPLLPDALGNGDFVPGAGQVGDRPSGTFDRKLGGTNRSTFQRGGPAPCSLEREGGNGLGDTVILKPNCTQGLFAGQQLQFSTVLGENGQIGRNTFRGPGFARVDFAVFKHFLAPQLGDRVRVQFRAEFFNLFNRVNLLPVPVPDLTSPNFGTVGAAFDAREIQFALKILF